MKLLDIYNEVLMESTKPKKLDFFELHYSLNGLSPEISKKTVDLHFNTLTKNYIKNYNKDHDEFQYAGAFLHEIYWNNLTDKNQDPTSEFLTFIKEHFKNLNDFKAQFTEVATTIHGNGWCALLKSGKIIQIPNHKVVNNIVLIQDMWEHAYIMDYGADKKAYMKGFWNIVDWDKITKRL